MLQMESSECGVVSLAMVLGYFGRWIPIESLRIDCSVGRDGTNAANILRAGRAHGLNGKGYRLDDCDFDRFDFPVIIHWNYKHFVVLEHIDKDTFTINDPAHGRREISRSEFEAAFTGVVLAFEKGENFKPKGEKPNWFKTLKTYFTGVKPVLLQIILLGLIAIVPGALMPIASKIFVDNILIEKFTHWLPYLLVGMLVVSLIQSALSYFQRYIMLILQTRLSLFHISRYIQNALELPLRFFAQRSSAEMAVRPQLIDSLSGLISGPLGMAVIGWVTALTYMVVMFFYDVKLTLCIVTLALVNSAIFLWQARQFRTLNQVIIKESTQYMGASMQSLQLLGEVKASGTEKQLFEKLVGHKTRWMNQENKLIFCESLLNSLHSFLQVLSTALLLLVGGSQVMKGEMTLGVFIAFQGLMNQFMAPLQQVLGMYAELQEAQGNIDRIEDITGQSEKEPISWGLEQSPFAALRPHLSMNNITFSYESKGEPLLENFNLEVTPGKWVALVGKSGSGKSTLAKLVAGLYKPHSGTITYGGHNLSDIPNDVFSDNLAMVDQEIVLFNSSVADNISFWDRRVTDEKIQKAAKTARIHEWIIRLQNGYDYRIAENGKNISGGEKARIEIARALASDPSFIILDEASAALDPLLEREIIGDIRNQCDAGIIISHRISSIQNCDEIIVFDQGKPVARGTHSELLTNSVYREMVAEEAVS